MAEVLFKTEQDITNEWLFYIENEAKSLSQRDEFAIENYLDREMFNPLVSNFLEMEETVTLIKSVNEVERLSLNLVQGMRANFLPNWLQPRFRNLKAKIKKVFCTVINGIGELDTKGIIKAVLLALIPAFATGVPAAVLPIVIGLIAFLIKYGIERTCPV